MTEQEKKPCKHAMFKTEERPVSVCTGCGATQQAILIVENRKLRKRVDLLLDDVIEEREKREKADAEAEKFEDDLTTAIDIMEKVLADYKAGNAANSMLELAEFVRKWCGEEEADHAEDKAL